MAIWNRIGSQKRAELKTRIANGDEDAKRELAEARKRENDYGAHLREERSKKRLAGDQHEIAAFESRKKRDQRRRAARKKPVSNEDDNRAEHPLNGHVGMEKNEAAVGGLAHNKSKNAGEVRPQLKKQINPGVIDLSNSHDEEDNEDAVRTPAIGEGTDAAESKPQLNTSMSLDTSNLSHGADEEAAMAPADAEGRENDPEETEIKLQLEKIRRQKARLALEVEESDLMLKLFRLQRSRQSRS